jgi:hypothetical protein
MLMCNLPSFTTIFFFIQQEIIDKIKALNDQKTHYNYLHAKTLEQDLEHIMETIKNMRPILQ